MFLHLLRFLPLFPCIWCIFTCYPGAPFDLRFEAFCPVFSRVSLVFAFAILSIISATCLPSTIILILPLNRPITPSLPSSLPFLNNSFPLFPNQYRLLCMEYQLIHNQEHTPRHSFSFLLPFMFLQPSHSLTTIHGVFLLYFANFLHCFLSDFLRHVSCPVLVLSISSLLLAHSLSASLGTLDFYLVPFYHLPLYQRTRPYISVICFTWFGRCIMFESKLNKTRKGRLRLRRK